MGNKKKKKKSHRGYEDNSPSFWESRGRLFESMKKSMQHTESVDRLPIITHPLLLLELAKEESVQHYLSEQVGVQDIGQLIGYIEDAVSRDDAEILTYQLTENARTREYYYDGYYSDGDSPFEQAIRRSSLEGEKQKPDPVSEVDEISDDLVIYLKQLEDECKIKRVVGKKEQSLVEVFELLMYEVMPDLAKEIGIKHHKKSR